MSLGSLNRDSFVSIHFTDEDGDDDPRIITIEVDDATAVVQIDDLHPDDAISLLNDLADELEFATGARYYAYDRSEEELQ